MGRQRPKPLRHDSVTPQELRRLIHARKVTLAGHVRLGIYGTLRCHSGKRMKPKNRVFFATEAEALAAGYRPCGHCLRAKYKAWLWEPRR